MSGSREALVDQLSSALILDSSSAKKEKKKNKDENRFKKKTKRSKTNAAPPGPHTARRRRLNFAEPKTKLVSSRNTFETTQHKRRSADKSPRKKKKPVTR